MVIIMYLDIRLYTTSLDNLIWSVLRPSHLKSGNIEKNIQKKSGIMSHFSNIMNGIMTINKKRRTTRLAS